jgi:hypothetical protein
VDVRLRDRPLQTFERQFVFDLVVVNLGGELAARD